MSVETTTSRPQWTDTEQCPFCGDQLTDAGAGFIDHIDEEPTCESSFESWRTQVAGDMDGEWSG
ncbi:hypothetical protein ACFO0N_03045 [Halobium salinum]|uniref:Small CPxCG-related zinc finger protein n=1 Tax=Halobium salinum TaxID=1364940 RepID=A0ABD5P7P7_9EURY|nr:hypothetical protein [Halobium salinum]